MTINKKSAFFIVVLIALFSMPLSHGYAVESKHKIYDLSPEKIAAYIEDSKGRKKVIFLYASWSQDSRAVVPKIIQLEQFRKGSVIAISLDKKPEDLMLYTNMFETIPFPVVILSRFEDENLDRLNNSLSPFGILPSGGIPDMILMDEENHVVDQGDFKDNMSYVAKFLFGKVKKTETE